MINRKGCNQQLPEQKDFEPNSDDQREGEHWLGWQ